MDARLFDIFIVVSILLLLSTNIGWMASVPQIQMRGLGTITKQRDNMPTGPSAPTANAPALGTVEHGDSKPFNSKLHGVSKQSAAYQSCNLFHGNRPGGATGTSGQCPGAF